MKEPKITCGDFYASQDGEVICALCNCEADVIVCEDCGKPSDGNQYMHVQISGLFVRLCSDCLEGANLLETIYAEPCHECHGSGRAWEGWECEECDGTGTNDF